VETVSGSVTSTKQFIWNFLERLEERNSVGSTTKSFYDYGVMDSSVKLFCSRDQLDSVRDVVDLAGNVVGQYSYSPFGDPVLFSGSNQSDRQFGNFYIHQRSALNFSVSRIYISRLSRWMTRDLLEEGADINLYGYTENDPIGTVDPLGLWPTGARGRNNADQRVNQYLSKVCPTMPEKDRKALTKAVLDSLGWTDVGMAFNLKAKCCGKKGKGSSSGSGGSSGSGSGSGSNSGSGGAGSNSGSGSGGVDLGGGIVVNDPSTFPPDAINDINKIIDRLPQDAKDIAKTYVTPLLPSGGTK